MSKYYMVNAKIKREDDKGKIKKVSEKHLVDAMSVTEAEVRVTKYLTQYPEEFEISSVNESRIANIVSPNETPSIYAK